MHHPFGPEPPDDSQPDDHQEPFDWQRGDEPDQEPPSRIPDDDESANPLEAELPDIEGIDGRKMFDALMNELRAMASRALGGQAHSVRQPTALVNEAYVRLMRNKRQFRDKLHFMRAVARTMQTILIDYWRQTRGNDGLGVRHHLYDELVHHIEQTTGSRMDEIHSALEKLETINPAWAELVRLRFFLGLTVGEAAEVQGISKSLAEQHWTFIRKFLFGELGD